MTNTYAVTSTGTRRETEVYSTHPYAPRPLGKSVTVVSPHNPRELPAYEEMRDAGDFNEDRARLMRRGRNFNDD